MIVACIVGQLRGIIVDAIHDIVTLNPEQLQAVPDVGETAATALLEGIATIEGTLIIVLDLAKLVGQAVPLAQAA